jgi:hypothetical protein
MPSLPEVCIYVNATTGILSPICRHTASTTYIYTISPTNPSINISVYGNDVFITLYRHEYFAYAPNVTIDWDYGYNGTSLKTMVAQSEQYQLLFYIILLIFGIIMGFMAEKYYNGYGIYGTGSWYMILGLAGLPLFYIPLTPIVIYVVLKHLLPILK